MHVKQDGVALFRSIVMPVQLTAWASQIKREYERLETARQHGGPAAVHQLIAPDQRFVPTASSLTLGAVFSDEDLKALLADVLAGPAGAWIRSELRSTLACDVNQAWIRRQYAARHYPPLHAPHGWHQHGGLGFDFLSHPDGSFPANALLPMVTCWLAL